MKGEQVKFMKELSKQSIQARVISSLGDDIKLMKAPSTTRQGFVVLEGCYEVFDKLISRENHLFLFKDYNLWLFIDDDVDFNIEVRFRKLQ